MKSQSLLFVVSFLVVCMIVVTLWLAFRMLSPGGQTRGMFGYLSNIRQQIQPWESMIKFPSSGDEKFDPQQDTDIVISLCEENLQPLLDQLATMPRVHKVYIYRKCSKAVKSWKSLSIVSNALPNIGREGHTYLYHMLHCPNLANYTIFLQANPVEHFFPGHTLVTYFTNKAYHFPISGQLILVKGAQYHRIRDGFRALFVCHGGKLIDTVNWEEVNVQRMEQLLTAEGLWGNEALYTWDAEFCTHRLDYGIAFLGGGPWQCNFVPLVMPWNTFDPHQSIHTAIEHTWNQVLLSTSSQHMPKSLYYTLGGQFTLSKSILESVKVRKQLQAAYEVLANSESLVEGFHIELLWGYLFDLPSILQAKYNVEYAFCCKCHVGGTNAHHHHHHHHNNNSNNNSSRSRSRGL